MNRPGRASSPAPTLTVQQAAVLDTVRERAGALCAALNDAVEADISQAVLLPELVSIMREAGLLPAGMKIPFVGR